MKIHPIAEMFPMMTEEELDELATDIKKNGLLNPIIKDKDDVLIDGRNRLEACKRANILPTFETLNGTNPIAYILAQNVKRRHLSKGQQAMAVAIACSDSEQTVRKAAQSGAAAERKMKLADEAKRRAKGKVNTFLREITD